MPAFQKPALKTVEKSVSKIEPQKPKREIFADYLSSFEQREISHVESPVEPAPIANNLEASVERLFLEEEALRKAAEELRATAT